MEMETIEFNLLLAEIYVEIASGRVPTDEMLIAYKENFDTTLFTGEFESLMCSRLIKQLSNLYLDVKANYGEEGTTTLYTDILNKINLLVCPVNVRFFVNYIKASYYIKDFNVDLSSRLFMLDSCLIVGEPIDNVLYEIEFYNYKLQLLLSNLPKNINQIQPTSTILKAAIVKRDATPLEALNY